MLRFLSGHATAEITEIYYELVHAIMNDYNRAGMTGYNDMESLDMDYGDARKIRNDYICQ